MLTCSFFFWGEGGGVRGSEGLKTEYIYYMYKLIHVLFNKLVFFFVYYMYMWTFFKIKKMIKKTNRNKCSVM